jgi:ferritin-like metal-binding protein YciE
MTEKVAPDLLDGALATGATHVEHYEIATYEGLLAHAETMGAEDVVALLEENLEQEKQALGKIEASAVRLTQRASAGVSR